MCQYTNSKTAKYHEFSPPTKICFLRLWHDSFLDPSSNSHGSVQHYHCDSFPSLSCNFRGFVLQCQHESFPDPSCNFRGFVHDFSLGLSFSCHGFVLHCHHGSSLIFLDNPPYFCQLSSDCLCLPRSTTPGILHVFTFVLSSHVHIC